MKTKKIATACFVGGVVGTATALTVAPLIWWLGMLAGFGTGYLCYDLKRIWEALPVARRTAKKGSGYALTWLVKPHPFLLLHMIIFSLVCAAILLVVQLKNPFDLAFGPILISLCVSFSLTTYLGILAKTAALARKCFWESHSEIYFSRLDREYLLQKNYRQIPATYKNIYAFMIKGLGKGLMDKLTAAAKEMMATAKGIRAGVPVLLRFLFWDIWVLMTKFLWILFKLIHSQKRVLCGIDSAIGTAIAYFFLGINATTSTEKVMVIICGGIIGAMVGVLNFEIISKRILRLVPTQTELHP